MAPTIRRVDEDGLPDEIVGDGAFHLERMDTGEYYLCLDGLAFFFRLRGRKPRLTLRDHQTWAEAKASLEGK